MIETTPRGGKSFRSNRKSAQGTGDHEATSPDIVFGGVGLRHSPVRQMRTSYVEPKLMEDWVGATP